MFDEHLAARERRELYDEEHIKGRERTELEDYDEERDEWWNGQRQEEEGEMMEKSRCYFGARNTPATISKTESCI